VPIHSSAAYAAAAPTALPVAEELARISCSLPMHPRISEVELERVAAGIHEFDALMRAA
jgi:dTDP-4-amino-4,6-dideoxygalactose transaminase